MGTGTHLAEAFLTPPVDEEQPAGHMTFSPSDTWEQVDEWRKRAEEIRTVAESFSVPSAKDSMLNLACSYERMADELERWLKGRPGQLPSSR